MIKLGRYNVIGEPRGGLGAFVEILPEVRLRKTKTS